MKKIINITMMLSVVLFSCSDFLEEDNKAGAPNEKVYSTEAGYETLHTNAYFSLRKLYEDWSQVAVQLAGSDIYQQPRSTNNPIYKYVGLNATNDDVKNFYNYCYEILQGVNAAEYWLSIAPLSNDKKKLYQAEYDFFKGFVHFLLIEQFGGIVINDEYTMSPRLNMSRETLANSYEYVIGKLESALAGPLPQTDKTGKICKDIVNHYLAKAYLTRGWDLGNSADFTAAKTHTQAVMTSRGELTQTFTNLWSPTNENNNEVIFAVQYDKGSLLTPTSGNIQQALFGPYLGGDERTDKYMSTQCYPSWNLHAWFDQNDARYEATFMLTVWKEYYEYYAGTNPTVTQVTAVYPRVWGDAANREMFDEFLLLTEGYDASGAFRNLTMQDNTASDNVKPAAKAFIKKWSTYFQAVTNANDIKPWGGGTPFTSYLRVYPFINHPDKTAKENETLWRSGYISDYCQPVIKKFDMTIKEVFNTRQSYRDVVLATLSETMLLYAEACIGLADYPTAEATIKKVLARPANSKSDVPLTVTLPANKEGALEVYLKESAKELAGQFCGRWPELRRTKMLEYMYTKYNYDSYLPENALTVTEKSFMNYRPIPQDARDRNESLEQNPGYDQ